MVTLSTRRNYDNHYNDKSLYRASIHQWVIYWQRYVGRKTCVIYTTLAIIHILFTVIRQKHKSASVFSTYIHIYIKELNTHTTFSIAKSPMKSLSHTNEHQSASSSGLKGNSRKKTGLVQYPQHVCPLTAISVAHQLILAQILFWADHPPPFAHLFKILHYIQYLYQC